MFTKLLPIDLKAIAYKLNKINYNNPLNIEFDVKLSASSRGSVVKALDFESKGPRFESNQGKW